jgi:uncharacterized protein YoxC
MNTSPDSTHSLRRGLCLLALVWLLGARATAAVLSTETLTFDSSTLPAPWALWPSNYGARDFANQRMNAYSTDATHRIYRNLSLPATATKLVVSFNGNSDARSSIGGGNYLLFTTAAGTIYDVAHGYGADTPGSEMHAYVGRTSGSSYGRLVRVAHPRASADYTYTITITNGAIAHRAVTTGGAVLFDYVAQDAGLRVADLNRIDVGLYVTTSMAIWVDNLTVTAEGADRFTDPFDTFNAGRWQVVGGAWSVGGGQMTGSWSQGAAQTDQGNLLLASQDLAANFDAYFAATLVSGAPHGFALYFGPGNKYNVNVGTTGANVERRLNGGNYTAVAATSYAALPATPSIVHLNRTGAQFTLRVNGTSVLQFTDATWGGALRVGLRVYGTAVYDAFALNEPLDDCAVLEQALADALAALNSANAQIAGLNQQVAGQQQQLATITGERDTLVAQVAALTQQLQVRTQERDSAVAQIAVLNQQVAGLNQQVAGLQQQLATITGERDGLQSRLIQVQAQLDAALLQVGGVGTALAALQANLRTEFNDPGFVIPGATPAAQVRAVVEAIIQLNRGRKQDVYGALK